MRTDSLHVDLYLEPPLFPDAQNVGKGARCLDGRPAALVDREGSRQLFRMVFGQPTETVTPPMLFIGPRRQDQTVIQLYAVPFQQTHGHHLGGEQPLAI